MMTTSRNITEVKTNGNGFHRDDTFALDKIHGHVSLTLREKQILIFISNGLQNKEIARTLGISSRTVVNHISSIFIKLNAGNRVQAINKGYYYGYIKLFSPSKCPQCGMYEEKLKEIARFAMGVNSE